MSFISGMQTNQIEESIERIKEILTNLVQQNEMLREENLAVKAENYKDKEFEKMSQKVREAYIQLSLGFGITKEETEAINDWKEQHLIDEHNNTSNFGAIGGNFAYHFIPTSIGTIGYCQCGACYQNALHQKNITSETIKNYLEKHNAEYVFQEI